METTIMELYRVWGFEVWVLGLEFRVEVLR